MMRFLKNPSVPFRVGCFVLMLALVIWGYWWLVCLVAFFFLILFPLYYEIILWGILYDSLYGIPVPLLGGFDQIFTVIAIILFVCSYTLRHYVLAYER